MPVKLTHKERGLQKALGLEQLYAVRFIGKYGGHIPKTGEWWVVSADSKEHAVHKAVPWTLLYQIDCSPKWTRSDMRPLHRRIWRAFTLGTMRCIISKYSKDNGFFDKSSVIWLGRIIAKDGTLLGARMDRQARKDLDNLLGGKDK